MQVSQLRSRIPVLPADFEQRLDEPLSAYLSHGGRVAVAAIAMDLNPDLDRRALLDPDLTGRVLAYWFEGASFDAAPRASGSGKYSSHSVYLDVLKPEDSEHLYLAAMDPEASYRWRFRGATVSREAFRASLADPTVTAQLAIRPMGGTSILGIVVAYEANPWSRNCKIGYLGTGNRGSLGLVTEGLLLFVQYVFDHFDFLKLYLEVPEYNITLLEEEPKVFEVEGCLSDHLFYRGEWWSQFVLALYRGRWNEIVDGLRGHEVAPEDRPAQSNTSAFLGPVWAAAHQRRQAVLQRESDVKVAGAPQDSD